MEKKADVRSTPEGYELRVNGTWKLSSKEEVHKLLDEGWPIRWNLVKYRLTPYPQRCTRDRIPYGIEYLN